MYNSQVRMPSYRENSLIIPFKMLCPGISQNTKHHQLTLYKGQVWREKSYLELCNHNVLNIVYDLSTINKGTPYHIKTIVNDGELYVPPVPDKWNTMIPWDTEILQSFAELTNITRMTFKYLNVYEEDTRLEDVTYQLVVGNYLCRPYHHNQCVPPHSYIPWYIWTKDGFKIQIKIFRFTTRGRCGSKEQHPYP